MLDEALTNRLVQAVAQTGQSLAYLQATFLQAEQMFAAMIIECI